MGELKNRTRIGIIMDNTIFEWLKDKHEKTDIPQSRIIEKALVEVYGKEIEEFKKRQEE
ncbi:MAG: ribbon-helix-helix domain-containing protein [Fibrobacter sp.]|nr:ribbon-helix-helix domain-containing protein [Fibrobacter sp.]